MTTFNIKVVSDVVCPWCYVGRKKLLAAQRLWTEKHPDAGDSFNVTFQPFQLNPAMSRGPGASVDKHDYYKQKFGPRAAQLHAGVSQAGEPVGISFSFGGRTGNTRDAHRLVHLAQKYGSDVELRAVDGLFAAYHENERDITDYDALKAVAVEAGVPEADFQRAIVDSDEGGAEVDEAVRDAREGGVSGVPEFVIQDRVRLNGARDPTEFLRAFEAVKQLEAEKAN